MYLPFLVRKTLGLRVYVTSISNVSILHNNRQQTFTNDNKREQFHPTKISSVHSIVVCISYNYRDVKPSTMHSKVPAKEKPKNL
jgi:hypothetical protein